MCEFYVCIMQDIIKIDICMCVKFTTISIDIQENCEYYRSINEKDKRTCNKHIYINIIRIQLQEAKNV